MKTKKTISIVVLFGLFSSLQAMAVSCGDVITTNTTLTHDLHCSSGYRALEIGADNITLDLNGYTLSGTTDLAGISVYGKNKVSIIGNGGVIKGFWVGVNSSDSNKLRVEGVSFYDLGSGVIVASGSEAVIQDNDFMYIEGQGVFITNFVAGNQANYNLVSNNEFYKSNVGIEICGDDSDFNTLEKNLIWNSNYSGIRIKRSDNNLVTNNDILETIESAIRLDDSSRNKIFSNSFRKGYVGLEIYAASAEACLNTGNLHSFKNEVQGNHLIGYQTAVALGTGLSIDQVFSNLINHNKLYNNNTGLLLNSDSYQNNATSNAYSGTTTPVIDRGVDNYY